MLALLVALVSAVVQWRKGSVDESALVLGKWKELVDAHQSQIEILNSEIKSLRQRLTDAEKEFADYRRATDKRIQELVDENAGLRRAIIQNSRSGATLIEGKEPRPKGSA